jgi:NADH-quinone oxidoreductase subunit K
MNIPIEQQLLLAGILFLIGLTGLLVRRNLLFMLMSLEIMMNSAGLAFIMVGAHFNQPDGQVMFIFILSVAAAEVSVALALVILMFKHFKTLDTKNLNTLK